MRGRGAVLGLVLGATSSLVVEGVAVAAHSAVAAPAISLNAPVGIVAVAFGVVGLVAGLVRRRKAAVVRATAPTAVTAPVATAPVVSAAVPVAAPTKAAAVAEEAGTRTAAGA